VQSSLLLVDVISQDPKSGPPVRDFQKKDFRMFDNRHEIPIATFYAGARYATRPVTLWLVVICNESGGKILHYMAKQTGGQYFDALPSGYAAALQAILMQLHFRYERGFIPTTIDGKRHELKVELKKKAKEQHKRVRLRFRPEYIPVREWAR
jgi:hypothetical protein